MSFTSCATLVFPSIYSSPFHCMSHESLDHTTCPVSIQIWSAAQVHMAGCLRAITIPDGPAVCRSLQVVIRRGNMTGGVLGSRQYCAGTRLRAKSACGGTHQEPWLRPKERPAARFSGFYSPASLQQQSLLLSEAQEFEPISGAGCRCSSPIARRASAACIETTADKPSSRRPLCKKRDIQGSPSRHIDCRFC